MSETVKPLGSRVLLEVLEEQSVTASGLVIPDTARTKQQRGVVVAVGEAEDLINVTIGQKVMFPQYTGVELSFDGKDYLVIDSSELLAVIGG